MKKWFSIKSLYQSKVIGKPQKTDNCYDSTLSLVEERIVLFKAKTSKEAIRKAEKEARQYASENPYVNPYAQKVVMKYLCVCDVFELYDEVKELVEVYSTTRLLNTNLKLQRIVEAMQGKREDKKTFLKRKKFFNKEFCA